MKSFQFLSGVKAFVPANDQDKYAFFEQKKQVFLWSEGEWYKKIFWDVDEAAAMIGSPIDDVRYILVNYKQFFLNRKKIGVKGHYFLSYGDVLKIKYMLDARAKRILGELTTSGVIENLYGRSKDYHAL